MGPEICDASGVKLIYKPVISFYLLKGKFPSLAFRLIGGAQMGIYAVYIEIIKAPESCDLIHVLTAFTYAAHAGIYGHMDPEGLSEGIEYLSVSTIHDSL